MKKEIGFDELLQKIENKYILTVVAGKRGREIDKGAEPLVKVFKKDTTVKKVFREIASEKIGYEIQEENIEG